MLHLVVFVLVMYLSMNYDENKELNSSALFSLFSILVIVDFVN